MLTVVSQFYTIVVRWSPPNDRVIHLVRRYRQFSALHTQLLQQHPAAMKQLAVSLPPKELFGTLSVHSRERRRIGLEAYLRALTGIPELMQSAPALMFFNPEYNVREGKWVGGKFSERMSNMILIGVGQGVGEPQRIARPHGSRVRVKLALERTSLIVFVIL